MTYPGPLDVSRGGARGVETIARQGVLAATVDYQPVADGGVVQLPPPSGSQQLKAISTSANDTAAGSGGRFLFLAGLDSEGNKITEVLPMNGLGSTGLTVKSFWRLHTATIFLTGIYQSSTDLASYDGIITITDGADNQWAIIERPAGGIGPATWNSSFYTVAKGCRTLISDFAIATQSTKIASFIARVRVDANNEVSPTPWVEVNRIVGETGVFERSFRYAFGPLREFTDLGVWGAMTQTTGNIGVGYTLVEIKGPE